MPSPLPLREGSREGEQPSRTGAFPPLPPAPSRKGRGSSGSYLLLAALIALGGCRLIDQRTFAGTPTAPSAAELARPELPKLPLLTIAFAIPDADWRPALRAAVLAAEARKPGVAFNVVTPIPTAASRAVQDTFATQGQEDSTMVGRELQSDGVPPERITVGFRGDPGSPRREVRIYAQ